MRIDGIETQTKIINTAEALYAEHGIDNVTFLDINKASGQRNRNAIKYYFDDREQLLKAVLIRHSESIQQRRNELLTELGKQQDYTLRDIMQAIVYPLADKLAEGESGIAYIQLNGQLMENPAYRHLRTSLGIDLKNNKTLYKMISKHIKTVPGRISDYRSIMVESLMYHSLSAFASKHIRDSSSSATTRKKNLLLFTEELVNAICTMIE